MGFRIRRHRLRISSLKIDLTHLKSCDGRFSKFRTAPRPLSPSLFMFYLARPTSQYVAVRTAFHGTGGGSAALLKHRDVASEQLA